MRFLCAYQAEMQKNQAGDRTMRITKSSYAVRGFFLGSRMMQIAVTATSVAACAVVFCRGESPRQFWPLDDGAGSTATNAVPGGNAGTLVNISDGWDSDVPAALTHSTGSLAFGTNGAQYV
ncbi:MAG TPA: hypothetical protein PLW27_09265, partial [Kiritimatiellia bacterium]|nr:hypothetical protein [Kiritimatiellia bacterium]